MININRDSLATLACTIIALDDIPSPDAMPADAYIDASMIELRDDTDSLLATFAPNCDDDTADRTLASIDALLADDATYDFIIARMTDTYNHMTR